MITDLTVEDLTKHYQKGQIELRRNKTGPKRMGDIESFRIFDRSLHIILSKSVNTEDVFPRKWVEDDRKEYVIDLNTWKMSGVGVGNLELFPPNHETEGTLVLINKMGNLTNFTDNTFFLGPR